MPLITNVISEARSAYAILEQRTVAAENSAASLKASLDTLASDHAALVDSLRLQSSYTASQVSTNGILLSQLSQQVATVPPDLTLDNFIASLGLSIALAEATMPDRTVGTVSASVQSFLTFTVGPDGVTRVPGLRLYQPELGASTALATTSFDLAKTTVTPGTPNPKSLYAVLLAKQALFAQSFWIGLTAGSPPTAPGQQIVAEIVKVFDAIGSWSFPFVLQEAVTLSTLETGVATALTNVSASVPPAASAAAIATAAAYASGVQTLQTLLQGIANRTFHVAGDLYALSAALDATTALASAAQAVMAPA